MELHFAQLGECMESIQSCASVSVAKVNACVSTGVGEALTGKAPCTQKILIPSLGQLLDCHPELCGQADCTSGLRDPNRTTPQSVLHHFSALAQADTVPATASISGPISEALALCNNIYRRDSERSEVLHQVQRGLEMLRLHCQQLLQAEQTLGAQAVPLEVVQSIIRIQSARLDGEAEKALLSLSAAIEAVCTRLLSSLHNECALLRKTTTGVSEMNRILLKIASQSKESSALHQEAQNQLAELELQSQEQSGEQRKLAVVSQLIQQAVGGLVQGLQYEDIVAQRLSNIERSLGILAQDRPAPARPAPAQNQQTLWPHNSTPNPDDGQKILQSKSDLTLAISEMSGSLACLSHNLAQVQQAEQTLHAQLKEVFLDRRRRHIKSQMQSAFEGAICLAKRNQEELQSVRKLLHGITESSAQIGQELGAVAAQLSRTALNAQVQAARFGEKSGLDIVVHSLSQVADQLTCCSLGLGQAANSLHSESLLLHDKLADLCQEAIEIRAEAAQVLPKIQQESLQNELSFRQSILAAISTLEFLAQKRIKMESVLLAAHRPLRDLEPLARRFELISPTPAQLQAVGC